MEQDLYLHGLIGGAPAETPLWTRPVDWPAEPTFALGEEKVWCLAGLVPNSDNEVSVSAVGNYTVDWGDGTITNHASGVTARRVYATIPAVGLLDNGLKGFVVIITPQAGQQLTSVTLSVNPSNIPKYGSIMPWLEMRINAPNLTTIIFDNYTTSSRICEYVWIGENNISDWTYKFTGGMQSLRKVDIEDFLSATTAQGMFDAVQSLLEVTINNAESLPLLTNTKFMFNYCYALRKVPLFDTSNVTEFAGMFLECWTLTTIPNYNTSNGLKFWAMFSAAYSLLELPNLDLSNATDCNSMFYGLYSPITLIQLDISSVTNSIVSMFDDLNVSAIDIVLPNATISSANNFINNCKALTKLSISNMNLINSVNYMFNSISLRSINGIVNFTGLSNNTSCVSPFGSNIRTVTGFTSGITKSLNLGYVRLNRDTMLLLFNALSGSPSPGATITIDATCPGYTELTGPDLAIATGKGWVIAV